MEITMSHLQLKIAALEQENLSLKSALDATMQRVNCELCVRTCVASNPLPGGWTVEHGIILCPACVRREHKSLFDQEFKRSA